MEPWEDRQYTSVDLLCYVLLCVNAARGCGEPSEPKKENHYVRININSNIKSLADRDLSTKQRD